MFLNESTVEDTALGWFADLGYATVNGMHIAPGELAAKRDSLGDVVLERRLRDAIARLNPDIPGDAKEEVLRKLLSPESPSLIGIDWRY